MIPTSRLVGLVSLPLLLALAYVVSPGALSVLLGLDLVLLVMVGIDALGNTGEVAAERQHPPVQSVGVPFEVTLVLANLGTRDLRLRVVDDVQGGTEGLPAELDLEAKTRVEVRYELTLARRGRFEFGLVVVRWRSPLGFWERQVRLELPEAAVRVYPDFRHLRRYGLTAREDERRLPVKVRRRLGGESEFQRLRPYVAGDPYRHIDWRATARRRQFVTREYGQESNQNVVFLVDGGRLMTGRLGALTGFDHALNASLAMAHVALRHGDRVGLLVFDRTVRAWVSPRGGARTGPRLLQATYDIFPTLEEPDYAAAFRHLASKVRRRSLVVVLTAMTDQVSVDALAAVVRAMGTRHLPLLVWLRDPALDQLLEAPARSHDALYDRCAAAELVSWREAALEGFRRAGALTVDVSPDGLTPELLGRYLEIKARRLL